MGNVNEALINAASHGDLITVKKLIKSGANINYFSNNSYRTVLGISACNGHLQVVQYLIEAGANPFLPFNVQSPRYFAIQQKQELIASHLEAIMKSPKWLNKIDDASGFTPLTGYIFNGNTQEALKLIDFGADVCKADKSGKTPLIYAIERNKLEIVKKLLQKGAIASGVSAVKKAFELKAKDILKCLVETKGLLIDAVFDDGFTALTKTLASNNQEIVKLLLDNGADPTTADLHKNNPLGVAIQINSVQIFELLLSKWPTGNNATVINEFLADGSTPLTKSIHFHKFEMLKYLIEKGADPEKVDCNNNVPLELAMELNSVEIADFLVSKGVKMARTIKETLFHKLAENGNIEVYRFLTRHGWEVNQLDKNGKSALALCAAKKYLLLSRFLIENGADIELAMTEVGTFQKSDHDFDCFIKQVLKQKKNRASAETGQE